MKITRFFYDFQSKAKILKINDNEFPTYYAKWRFQTHKAIRCMILFYDTLEKQTYWAGVTVRRQGQNLTKRSNRILERGRWWWLHNCDHLPKPTDLYTESNKFYCKEGICTFIALKEMVLNFHLNLSQYQKTKNCSWQVS